MRKMFPIIAGVAMMLVASIGHAEDTTKTYTAGSVGVTISQPGVASVNEAGGAVDCAQGVGGVCFDTHALQLQPFQTFRITATDAVSGKVGIFMGFDMDGDGCVACKNGAPGLGADNDVFFQGAGQVIGQIPCAGGGSAGCEPLKDPTLYVFVRLATLNSGDAGTTGTITIEANPQCGDGRACQPVRDKEMGQVCVAQGSPTGGPGCGQVMYPYPGV